MIVKHSTHPGWLSNAYLVADREGGTAVAIDSGAPLGPLFDALESHELRLEAILTTHRHADHVAGHAELADRTGAQIFYLRGEADPSDDAEPLDDGESCAWGGVRVSVMALPGHTRHHAGYVVDDVGLFSGDCIFSGSVGGCSSPQAGSFEEHRRSIVERVLSLPDDTAIYPGHAEATTVGRERSTNPFIRVMTGLDGAGVVPCLALDRPARLVVLARDFDGGTKAWVRFDDDGSDMVLPGRRVHIHVDVPRASDKARPAPRRNPSTIRESIVE